MVPLKGTAIVANPDTGAVNIESGKIYLRGTVRDVMAIT